MYRHFVQLSKSCTSDPEQGQESVNLQMFGLLLSCYEEYLGPSVGVKPSVCIFSLYFKKSLLFMKYFTCQGR